MKKIILFLTISLAFIFISCASDGAESASTTISKVENSEVVNEVSKVLTNSAGTIKNNTDELVPSDDKIDETVDKVADKLKGILKKGKKEVAEEIKKTSDVVSTKADEVVENISAKSKEVSKEIETRIDNTSKKVEAKIDEVIESIPEPKATSTPTPSSAPSVELTKDPTPKPAVKKTETKDIVVKKAWGKEDKPNHDYFDALLKKYVTVDGKVNYKGFKADDHLLEDYLSQLKNNPVHPDWTKKEKLAYWINAYNAYTIKLIVDNYPVKSITELHGGKPWDKKWIKLGDKTYSLNNIENDIIRPQFNEPRIHFAVNCAAKSCPPLSNSAWTPSNMEAKFEKATKQFINNPKYNSIGKNSATVSKIFDWYKEDFGDLSAYLNKYANEPLKSGGKIKFMDYDWGLNE